MKAPKIKTTLLVLSMLISITKTLEMSDLCQEGNINYFDVEDELRKYNQPNKMKSKFYPVTENFLIDIYKYGEDSFIVYKKLRKKLGRHPYEGYEEQYEEQKNALEMMVKFESDYRFQGYKKDDCNFKNGTEFFLLKYPIDHFKENLLTNEDQLKENIFWQIETMYKIAKIVETYVEKGVVHNKLTPEIFSLLNIYTPIIEDLTASTESGTPIIDIKGDLPFISPEYQKIHGLTGYIIEQNEEVEQPNINIDEEFEQPNINMDEEFEQLNMEEEKFVKSSPENDIYSLAGIFYFILTGKGGNWELGYDEDYEVYEGTPGLNTKNDKGYLLYSFDIEEEKNHFKDLLQKMSIFKEEERFNIQQVIGGILDCLVEQVRKTENGIQKLVEYLNNEENFLNDMEDALNSKDKILQQFNDMKNIFLERTSVIDMNFI